METTKGGSNIQVSKTTKRGSNIQILETMTGGSNFKYWKQPTAQKRWHTARIGEKVSNECHYCCFLVMMQKRCTKRNKLQKLHLFLRNRLRCPLQHFVCVCIVNKGCDSRSYNDISRDAYKITKLAKFSGMPGS